MVNLWCAIFVLSWSFSIPHVQKYFLTSSHLLPYYAQAEFIDFKFLKKLSRFFWGGINKATQCKITYNTQSLNHFSYQINEPHLIGPINCVNAFLYWLLSCVRAFPCCLGKHKAKQSKWNPSSQYFSRRKLLGEKMVDLLNVKKLIFLKILIFFGFSRRGQDKCVPSELNISYGCFLYAEKNPQAPFQRLFCPFWPFLNPFP